MKNNTSLKILKKNINNKYKLILFNKKIKDSGEIKHFPAYFNEWQNTVYSYNKNKMKNIPINNININKLIKIYFDLFFKNNRFLNSKYVYRRKIRHFLKKIYVSKAAIKHTNSKAVITLYTLNIGKKTLNLKYKNYLKNILFKKGIFRLNKDQQTLRNKKETKNIFEYFIRKLKLVTNHINNKLREINSQTNKQQVNAFKDVLKIKLRLLNKRLFYYNMFVEIWLIKAIKHVFYKDLNQLRRYQFLYLLNEFKLRKNFYLSKLSNKLSKILNKKVEFNLINLKSISYNTDIFTTALALKLRRKTRNNVVKNMWAIMNKGKMPKVDRLLEKGKLNRNVNKNLFENKYKDLNIISIFENKYQNLNELLKKIYFNNIWIKKTKIDKSGIWYSNKENLFFKSKRANFIFNSIKYKNMGGIRLEVKGRLTRRYRADRAVYKAFWKGGLSNTDSSFKRLSSVVFRGHLNSNVTYSMVKSKRRIGAFAVKGWISGK